MQCPNCGRRVRSKSQCAYCGYRFNSADKKEYKEKTLPSDDTPTAPDQTAKSTSKGERPQPQPLDSRKRNDHSNSSVARRSLEQEMKEAEFEAQQAYLRASSPENESEPIDEEEDFKRRADEVFSYPYTANSSEQISTEDDEDYILPKTKKSSSLLKKLFGFLIMLAILALLFLFGPQLYDQATEWWAARQSDSTETTEESSDKEASLQDEKDHSDSSQEMADKDQKSDNQAVQDEPSYHITKSDVDTSGYPRVKVKLSFAETLADVKEDTFDFKVQYNETEVPLQDNYTLEKVGKDILLSFVDPAVSVVGEDTSQQILQISGENFSDSVEYKVPADDGDKKIKEALNDIVNSQLAGLKDVSVFIQPIDEQVPYVYNDQVMNADQSIGWFVLQWIHELLAEGTIQPDQIIEVNDQLIASGDTGQVGTKVIPAFTLQDMINLVAMENDASAMNHLIQLAGGVNEFNLWLKKAGYFSTRMNAPLAIESGRNITGATTSATDLGSLMLKLAKDKLFTGNQSSFNGVFKETLMLSPNTLKFPGENANFGRRYEMMSSDLNNETQNYEGIIETSIGDIAVVIMADKVQSADSIIPTIRQIIEESLSYLINGDQETTQETMQETTSSQEQSVLPQENEPVATTVNENVGDQGHLSPSGEPVDNLYEGKQTENFYWFGDQYRRGTWYLGEDGAWFFR